MKTDIRLLDKQDAAFVNTTISGSMLTEISTLLKAKRAQKPSTKLAGKITLPTNCNT